MNIEYRKGNLLNDKANILINAVNKLGIMNGGIALDFKNKFPEMYESYKEICRSGKYDQGTCISYYTYEKDKHNGVCIANVLTVDDSLTGNYSFIETGLKQLVEILSDSFPENPIIAIPALGCGIGGLQKCKILNIIKAVFKETNAVLHLYNFEEDNL